MPVGRALLYLFVAAALVCGVYLTLVIAFEAWPTLDVVAPLAAWGN